MQTMIQKEAQTYAKWAGYHHQTAAINQYAAEWYRRRALTNGATEEVKAQCMAARIHITASVTEALMRRDGLVGPSDVRGMIGRTVLVRVTK